MACAAPKMDKAAIRKKMIQKRNALAPKEVVELSRAIEKQLFSCKEFLSCKNILYYLSFGSEVHTDAMIGHSIALHRKVYVPRIIKNVKRMEICEIESLDGCFKLNSFGIREPSGSRVNTVPSTEIDAVVAPGLAFDGSGGRIGLGGGYYDRLFEQLPDSALRLGIAYGFQLFDTLCQDGWDQKVHKIFTEKATLNC